MTNRGDCVIQRRSSELSKSALSVRVYVFWNSVLRNIRESATALLILNLK